MSKTANEFLEKTTWEVKHYTFDFSEELETTETISNASVTSSPTGTGHITLTSPAISGHRVQTTIAGGTASVLYLVTCKIQTNVSESIEGSGQLLVVTR